MTGGVLVTGFEPFGGEAVNPSQLVLQALQGWSPAPGVALHTQVLPCVFGDAIAAMEQAIARTRPSVVIALGQAANRDEVSVERIAINVDDARIPDNAGAQPIDRPIVAQGAAAHFATLPIKAIVAALHEAGIPAAVSQTAGTFVCNHVFYGLMEAIATRHADVRGGFIHLPCLPEQVQALQGRAGLPLARMVQAVRVAVTVSLAVRHDLRAIGGTVS